MVIIVTMTTKVTSSQQSLNLDPNKVVFVPKCNQTFTMNVLEQDTVAMMSLLHLFLQHKKLSAPHCQYTPHTQSWTRRTAADFLCLLFSVQLSLTCRFKSGTLMETYMNSPACRSLFLSRSPSDGEVARLINPLQPKVISFFIQSDMSDSRLLHSCYIIYPSKPVSLQTHRDFLKPQPGTEITGPV